MVIVVLLSQRLALIVQEDKLGEEFLREQVLESIKGLFAKVRGEILRACPEKNPSSRQKHEKAGCGQGLLEGWDFTGPLIESSAADNLEEHDILLILIVLAFESRHFTCQVLVCSNDQASLEGL